MEGLIGELDALFGADRPYGFVPARRKMAALYRVVHSGRPDAQQICQSPLPDGVCDLLSFRHAQVNPHYVDNCKSTIGGLPTHPQNVDIRSMSTELPFSMIGERLARLRKATSPELSQKAWAERHGFSPTQYNNWEKGSRRIPVDSAERLCNDYGLTLDFIYRGRRDGLSENAKKAV
ncbi:helix-turn-helix domain-containing protein [Salipiger abyssi]|uniref:helix-turn-helix domain-containing protein n=1 Tax=Salipiger abyssi TaxID=1250539 RepID=UPI0040599B3E